MPGEAVQLGPFTGGLTTRVSDPSSLDEKDLVEADNFIYDIYGALVTRPPITTVTDAPSTTPDAGEWEVVLSGFFSATTEPEVEPFIIITNWKGTWVKYKDDDWLKIADVKYWTAVQGSKGSEQVVWFTRGHSTPGQGSTDEGGWWKPGETTITQFSGIPGCNQVVWYKERLFFLNLGDNEDASLVRYSEIAPVDNDDFPSTNKLFINPNDGQSIRDAVVFLDNIFVFKYDSTYIITYDTGIDRVQIRPVSNTVGSKDIRQHLIYADTLFVYHNRFVWRFTGSTFVPLSQKIIVSNQDSPQEPTLSQWSDTIILRFSDVAYVYNFYTESWTTWSSDEMFNYIVKYSELEDYTEITYYGGKRGDTSLVKIRTVWPQTENPDVVLGPDNTEEFKARLQTKHYGFDTPNTFKRLFWWGVNAIIQSGAPGLRAGFFPIDEHSDHSNDTNWDNLEVPNPPATGAHTQMFKFIKSFRFRLASFYVELDCDGAFPQTINNITAVLKSSQTIVGNNAKSVSTGSSPMGAASVGARGAGF